MGQSAYLEGCRVRGNRITGNLSFGGPADGLDVTRNQGIGNAGDGLHLSDFSCYSGPGK